VFCGVGTLEHIISIGPLGTDYMDTIIVVYFTLLTITFSKDPDPPMETKG